MVGLGAYLDRRFHGREDAGRLLALQVIASIAHHDHPRLALSVEAGPGNLPVLFSCLGAKLFLQISQQGEEHSGLAIG